MENKELEIAFENACISCGSPGVAIENACMNCGTSGAY